MPANGRRNLIRRLKVKMAAPRDFFFFYNYVLHKCCPGLGPSRSNSNTVHTQVLTFALHVVFSSLLPALGQKTPKGCYNSDNITAPPPISHLKSLPTIFESRTPLSPFMYKCISGIMWPTHKHSQLSARCITLPYRHYSI